MTRKYGADGLLTDTLEHECSECGHTHWTGTRYIACNIEGCECPYAKGE